MNSFTKVAKAAIVGIVLSGSLLSMTACDNRSQPAASAPTSPAASQSASATPAATAAATTAPDGPMGVDIDDVMANHIDGTVATTFPNETKDSLKEGVTFALSTYQGLVKGNNFYRPRTASDITLLEPDRDKFNNTYYEAMTERATGHGGVIHDDFIAFGKGGEITRDADGVHVLDPDKAVNFVSKTPVVYASGATLVVKADATLFAPTTDNKLVTTDLTYWISVSHSGKEWLVEGMGFNTPNNPVVTDSVAAPEAPNGK